MRKTKADHLRAVAGGLKRVEEGVEKDDQRLCQLLPQDYSSDRCRRN